MLECIYKPAFLRYIFYCSVPLSVAFLAQRKFYGQIATHLLYDNFMADIHYLTANKPIDAEVERGMD